MGYKIRIKCNTCKYNEEFKIGKCQKESDINNVLPLLDEDNRRIIQDIRNKNNFISFTYNRKIGYCEKCKSLRSIGIINVYTKDGQSTEFQNKCNICNRKVIIFDIENNGNIRLVCSKCNKDELEIENMGTWE